MRLSAQIVLIIAAAGSVLLAATRIITNPKPDAELKQLFPSATVFSPLTGEPLHYEAYAADPRANPSAPRLGIAHGK